MVQLPPGLCNLVSSLEELESRVFPDLRDNYQDLRWISERATYRPGTRMLGGRGCGAGERVFIPRIILISSDLIFEFKRIQFPVKLAFEKTINKSQGQTIKATGSRTWGARRH
eukprot:157906-Hanusia_phi.AAC.1